MKSSFQPGAERLVRSAAKSVVSPDMVRAMGRLSRKAARADAASAIVCLNVHKGHR